MLPPKAKVSNRNKVTDAKLHERKENVLEGMRIKWFRKIAKYQRLKGRSKMQPISVTKWKRCLLWRKAKKVAQSSIIEEIKDPFPYSIVSPTLLHCKCETSLSLFYWQSGLRILIERIYFPFRLQQENVKC